MRAVGSKEAEEDDAPREPSRIVVVIVNILRGELLLAPWWCVNEGTSLVFAFVDANSATNDYGLLLTKSALEKKIINIIKPLLKNKLASSVVNRLAVSCLKMRALVNSMQILNILCQHTIIQLTALNVGTIFKSGIFEKSRNSKELKLTLEIMNRLTLEMQPAGDPGNCIVMVEYKLPLAGTGPNHNI